MARREPFWAAHRSHFYQRATDNGFTVWRVIGNVFALNVVLAILAIASVAAPSAKVDILLLVIGAATTASVMVRFSRQGVVAYSVFERSGFRFAQRKTRQNKNLKPGF